MGVSRIVAGVIGTAGHIDHGKSALVKRLTGTDPDRLKEEKERGMTTDLGFSSFLVPSGKRVGIIDVPGHERFVKNMIAGATGIKAALLVVAADDGVMPQTREHLRILELVGVGDGIVALTKTDLVDEELLALAREDVADLLEGTFLEDKAVIPVSSVTGDGFHDLETAIEEIASRFHEDQGVPRVFRMPVQRVFTAKGFGTVATGVPLSGEIRRGDTIEIVDIGIRAKIRGITAYHEPIESVRRNHSIGLNLQNVKAEQVHRGHTIAQPGCLSPVRIFEVDFECLPEVLRPIERMSDVTFHHGTVQRAGVMVLFDRERVEPGRRAFAQIRLLEPVFVVPGDRYIVRRPSPPESLGGGRILSLSGKKQKGKRWLGLGLEKRDRRVDGPASLLEYLLLESDGPISLTDLAGETLITTPFLTTRIEHLCKEGKITPLGSGDLLISSDRLERHRREFMNILMRYFEENPLSAWIEKTHAVALSGWRKELQDKVMETLEEEGRIEVDQGRIRLPAAGRGKRIRTSSILAGIEETVRENGFHATGLEELDSRFQETREEIRAAVGRLVRVGRIVPLPNDVFLHSDSLARARRLLLDHFGGNPGSRIGFAAFRRLLGTSSRPSDRLLEYFHQEGLLVARAGNLMSLSPRAREAGTRNRPGAASTAEGGT